MSTDRLASYVARGWVGGLLMAGAGDAAWRLAWWPLVLWLTVAALLAGWMLLDVRRDRGTGTLT